MQIGKVVSTLPGTLEADTIYMVRVGAGYVQYVTDSTGTVAYKSNFMHTYGNTAARPSSPEVGHVHFNTGD